MRRPITTILAGLRFAAVLLTLGSAAYGLSAPPCREITRRCPHCDSLLNVGQHLEPAPGSSNDQAFNPNAPRRRYRTDGSWPSRSLDQRVALCPVCRRHFWRRDAALVGDPLAEAAPEEWRSAPSVHCRAAVDWNAAIAEGLARAPGDLRYLSLSAWWDCNDDRCMEKDGTRAGAIRNLEKTVALLDASDPGDRLLRAEALRELGRFDEARSLLQSPVPLPYEGIRMTLLHHVDNGDSRAHVIPAPCQPTLRGGTSPACRGLLSGKHDETTEHVHRAVFDSIDALVAEPELTKAAVERIVGRSLAGGGDPGEWRHYQSDVRESDTIARVRLRQPPLEKERELETAVILEGADGSALSKKDVEDRYGIADKVEFQIRPTGATIHRYRRGTRSLTFVIRDDDALVEYVIVSTQ